MGNTITIGELIELLLEYNMSDKVEAGRLILMVRNRNGVPVGWIDPKPGTNLMEVA